MWINGPRCAPGLMRLMTHCAGVRLPCVFIHIATKTIPDTSS